MSVHIDRLQEANDRLQTETRASSWIRRTDHSPTRAIGSSTQRNLLSLQFSEEFSEVSTDTASGGSTLCRAQDRER